MYENHRQSITLTIPRVDGPRVGGPIALYERTVGLYASLVKINAYHQPGVEAGKKAAAAILDLQREIQAAVRSADSPLSLEVLAAAIGVPDRIETVYQIVRHLAANRLYVTLSGDPAYPASLEVSAIS